MITKVISKAIDENPKITMSVTGLVAVMVFCFSIYSWMTSTFALAETTNNIHIYFSTGLELNRLVSQLESKKIIQSSIQQEVTKNQIRVDEQRVQPRTKNSPPIPTSDILILENQKVELLKITKDVDTLQKRVDDLSSDLNKMSYGGPNQIIKK